MLKLEKYSETVIHKVFFAFKADFEKQLFKWLHRKESILLVRLISSNPPSIKSIIPKTGHGSYKSD